MIHGAYASGVHKLEQCGEQSATLARQSWIAAEMLILPPPVWALLYLIIAGAVSWLLPPRTLPELRVVWLGVTLVALGVAISAWAFVLFRREGTDINPTSATNKSL